MLGRKIIQWDFEDIAKGMSTSDDLADGGFSPNTDHVNPIAEYGILHHPAAATDASTNLTGQMIASCEDPSGSYDRLYVSTSVPDGRFYSMTSGVLTQRGSTDSTHQYVEGKTDMIAFEGEVFITSDSNLTRWSAIGAANTFDTAFLGPGWTNDFAPHPALVYNSFAYYGDGNLLLRQSVPGTPPTTILTLPTGSIIVALAIDPGSGQLLISVIGQLNLSGAINSGARVIFYNGSSTTINREVQVDDMVTAFPATEGALYAAYGQNLGLWNGSGITFLRRMNVSYGTSPTQLMYKHHFTSIGSTLYVIEKHKIIAYGPVRMKGDNVFYPAYANTPAGVATNLSNIANTGNNVLSLSFATSKFFLWDTISFATSATQDFYTNSYEFKNEEWIRWIRIVWKAQVNNNVDPGSLFLIDQDGVVTASNTALNGVIDLRNTSGAASAVKDLTNIDVRLKQVQIRMLGDTINPGIRRIIVYGDPANLPS